MQYKHWLVSILFIGALSFLVTCTQKPTAPVNDNPFDPLNPETHGDPFQLKASIENGGITLKWQMPAARGIGYFKLYRSVDTPNEFRRLKLLAANQTSYTDLDISNGHTYFYRITGLSKLHEETALSNVVPVVISTSPVLIINGDAVYANSTRVSLTIIAGAAKEMLLSNSADFNSAQWETFTAHKQWDLEATEGLKHVYLKIKYETDEVSDPVSDSITLDTTPPLAILTIIPDSGITNETRFQFDPTQSRDNFTVTSQLSMHLDVQNDGHWETDWQSLDLYQKVFETGGSRQAHLQIKDLAGNVSDTTVTYFVNTRPIAQFSVSVDANNDHLYHFDASASHDAEDGSNLRFRWDWQGDGTFDTQWLTEAKIDHQYDSNGTYHPQLSVKDQNGLQSTFTRVLKVGFTVTFDKTFGGNDYDFGNDVQQTPDGGYVLVGSSKSFGAGNYDVYLVRTDDAGNKLWAKTFGGSSLDLGNALELAADGLLIAGSTQSKGAGGSDVWLLKTDNDGTKVMDKTFGGSQNDEANGLQVTSDGGLILVGDTRSFGAGGSDIWLIRTDANGQKLWDRTFGGSGDELGYKVRQSTDGGFIIVGATKSFGSGDFDLWLVKTDTNGHKQWGRTFGGSLEDIGYDVRQTDDGGYIVCGSVKSDSPGNVSDVWLLKVDAQGTLQWQKHFGGDGTDEAYAVSLTGDGGFILTGYTDSFGNGLGDLWLIQTDANGDEIWNKTLGGSNFDKGKALQITTDGGYIVTGYTSSSGNGAYDAWLVKAE